MKTIKSAYLGVCRVEARDPHIQLFQLRNALNVHRDRLIHRVAMDLPRYLYCRFERTLTGEQLADLKKSLARITTQNVDLDKYASIVDQFRRRSAVQLNNQPFLEDIDSVIEWNLSHAQLRLAS